jgi:hypothetical protein
MENKENAGKLTTSDEQDGRYDPPRLDNKEGTALGKFLVLWRDWSRDMF